MSWNTKGEPVMKPKNYNIMVIGEPNVGKTMLLRSFMAEEGQLSEDKEFSNYEIIIEYDMQSILLKFIEPKV